MRKRKTKSSKKYYVLAIGIILLVAALIISILCYSRYALPSYATKDPKVKEAYLFARQNPEALTGVNCYCGCMQNILANDERLHSRGIIDCFLEPNGNWEVHGSTCARCVEEALTVKTLISQGKTKEEIKAAIDAKYKDAGLSCGTSESIVPAGQTCGASS